MANSILFNVANRVLGMLSSFADQEFRLALGMESDLKKLERNLSNIKAVLLDALEKQETNREIRIWLEQLQDVFYDAEDVLDEFECEALRRQVVKRGSIIRKVGRFCSHSNPIAFRFRMGHKIKEIREKLDEIAADRTKFHLTERFVDRGAISEREMTHSYVNVSNVIGRDNDKERIVELLMLPSGSRNVSVIPIIGIGGLGKTTLAKFVYNDARVIQHFRLKMWVCVSVEFNIKNLIAEILGSAIETGGEKYKCLSMDQLQIHLRRTLDGEKFLLVLDDVWNDDRQKWRELEDLLIGGADGSKILVTTRNLSVASIMGTVPTYNLQGLSREDCLSVFKKSAFLEGQEEEYPNLMKIGNGIVKKCGGVPLAVRTLGSLLYGKTDEHSWRYIQDNKIWTLEEKEKDILPALRLSYNMLPSHLKSCFAYCSIFPKNFVHYSNGLILFWMSHGLIQSSTENEELEDIGLRYFKELCSRSFFQDVTDHDHYISAKMHDLVHDLGLSILKRELSVVTFNTKNTLENVRHLLFSDTDLTTDQEVPEFMNKLRSLRTIYFPYKGVGPTSRSFFDMCISRFKYLWVLNLSHSTFEVVPSSIGNLKHLRYLDLSGSRRIKKLPNSICKLQNLLYLGLVSCDELEELPRNLGNLISLRTLFITTKQKILPKNGIGCLSSLRILFFHKCLNLEYLFEGMPHVTSLQTLQINSCSSLISLPLCNLKYLTTLKYLVIHDCEKLILMEEDGGHVLERLSLCFLQLSKLPQFVTLPQWLQGSADTLQFLRIGSCCNFTVLPEWLSSFTSLLDLGIKNCPNLLCLPEGTHSLSALKELCVIDCPALTQRCQPETGEDWLKIAHVPKIYLDDKKITPTV